MTKARIEDDRIKEMATVRIIENSPAKEILEKYAFSFQRKTSSTKLCYIRLVARYLMDTKHFDIDSFKDVLPVDIEMYLENSRAAGNKGEKYLSLVYAALTHFYEFLRKNHKIDANPVTDVDCPRENDDKPVVFMTPDEVTKLKDNIRRRYGNNSKNHADWYITRDLCLVQLGVTTGLRVSEIRQIDIDDIDFENLEITVTQKGNKTRRICFPLSTMESIEAWMADREEVMDGVEGENALFVSNRRTRWSVRTIQETIGKYTKDFNKKITPHKMRSTCASTLYEATGDINLAREVLGHTSEAAIKRYARASVARRRDSARLLGEMFA